MQWAEPGSLLHQFYQSKHWLAPPQVRYHHGQLPTYLPIELADLCLIDTYIPVGMSLFWVSVGNVVLLQQILTAGWPGVWAEPIAEFPRAGGSGRVWAAAGEGWLPHLATPQNQVLRRSPLHPPGRFQVSLTVLEVERFYLKKKGFGRYRYLQSYTYCRFAVCLKDSLVRYQCLKDSLVLYLCLKDSLFGKDKFSWIIVIGYHNF